MKVEQYKALNQFHIYSDIMYEQENGEQVDILQSYDSSVVKIITTDYDNSYGACTDRTITLGRDWDYSKTTQKYVYMFLEEYGNVYFTPNNTKKTQVQNMIEQHKIIYDKKMI